MRQIQELDIRQNLICSLFYALTHKRLYGRMGASFVTWQRLHQVRFLRVTFY